LIPGDIARGLPSGDQIKIQGGCIKDTDEQTVADVVTRIEALRLSQSAFDWSSVTSVDFLSFLSRQSGELSIVLKEFGTILLRAYYIDSRVRDAVGVGRRPPFPLGYAMPENDLYALEPVYDRGLIYREIEH